MWTWCGNIIISPFTGDAKNNAVFDFLNSVYYFVCMDKKHKIKILLTGRVIFLAISLFCFMRASVSGQEQDAVSEQVPAAIPEQERSVIIEQEQAAASERVYIPEHEPAAAPEQEQTYIPMPELANETRRGIAPVSAAFHDIRRNTLHSITHNYGLSFIGAGLATWGLIESGTDWKWNRLAYNNGWMPMIGEYANNIGYAIPVLAPVTLYLTGISTKNENLQITGLALTQSLMLSLLFQTPLKTVTGRTWPGIADGWDSPSSKRSDKPYDYSGEFNWFNLDAVGGWPSGHTAAAFSAAATVAQIYRENTWLKVAAYTYASLLGLGMSVYDHWASDVIAGGLIGFAVGTAVGKSYRNLIDEKENSFAFYATPGSVGLIIRK